MCATPDRQCKASIFGKTGGAKVSVKQLSFLEDGASLHLVMNMKMNMKMKGRSGMSHFDGGAQASGVPSIQARLLLKQKSRNIVT